MYLQRVHVYLFYKICCWVFFSLLLNYFSFLNYVGTYVGKQEWDF